MDSVSIMLNDENFKTWRRQALRKIKAKKLDKFIEKMNSGGMPLKFETHEDELVGKINQEYKDWETRDQLLYRWILVSLSPNLRMQMESDSHHAFQLWNKIETHFQLQAQEECKELLKQMQSLKKEKSKLIGRIKNISDKCQKIFEENDAIENELVKKYGQESIADLLPMNPAKRSLLPVSGLGRKQVRKSLQMKS